MFVKNVFKQLYSHSLTKGNPIWEIEYNCKNDNTLQQIEILFQVELAMLFKFHKTSEMVIPIIHLHFDEIIDLKHRSKAAEQKEIFSFLQFTFGMCATTQLNWDGEFIYCYECFMKSVFDRVYKNGEQLDLDTVDPFLFLNSKRNYISNSKEIIEQWFSQLYYYSKSFSGLNDWCEYFFEDVYYYLTDEFLIAPHHPQLLSNLLSWCEVNFDKSASNAIRNIIEREFNLIKWSCDHEQDEMKSTLGLQLLLCQDYKIQDKENFSIQLMANYDFSPLAKMQLQIAICYNVASLNKNFDSMLTAVTEFNNSLYNDDFTKINIIYQRARIFKNLLNSPISIAVAAGKSTLVENLLRCYYDIESPDEMNKLLLIIPNQLGKVIYCYNDSAIFDEKDSQKILVELVNIENRAFNSFRLLKGGVKQDITVTDNPIGLPSPKFAKDYEDKLLELYNFSKVEHDIAILSSMIQFDFNSSPLQALMIKNIRKTLPINLSLSKKLDFPIVSKIMFWSGFSQTSEIEKEALLEIFGYAKIGFEVHDEITSSLSNFLKRINEYNPDIIWISSHGEYRHYEPNLSAIKLSETESIGIRDFEMLVNNENKRRLLFLNICEGGVHAQTGEFKNIGFPNLLSAFNQDVVSHLWMAEPRFAYTFGVFLALSIAFDKKNYFKAFEYSLSVVLSDKENIINEFERFPIKLVSLKERVGNNDGTEWGNLISTGSPVYNI